MPCTCHPKRETCPLCKKPRRVVKAILVDDICVGSGCRACRHDYLYGAQKRTRKGRRTA